MTLTDVTIAGNSSGLLNTGAADSLGLRNTIVANSTAGPDCKGSLTDAGYNLDSDNTCGLTAAKHDLPGVAPKLAPLATNPQPFTATRALQPGSPAIDSGSCTDTSGVAIATDQRGVSRPFGAGCDIGAYELTGLLISISADWNLLDLPVHDPTLSSFSTLATSVNSQVGAGTMRVAAIYAGGRFTLYVPGYSPDGPLSPSSGIFVLSSQAGTWNGFLTVAGSSFYSSGQPIALHSGWNLVAAPFPYQGLKASAIAAQIDPHCGAGSCSVGEIATYSGGAYQTYVPGGGPDLTVPSTTGVWIQMSAPASWTPQ